MSWLNTLRQFFTLIFGVFLVLFAVHSRTSFITQSQPYTRLDHGVLKKINDFIYLTSESKGQVYKFNEQEQGTLPEEILKMPYLSVNKLDALPEIPNTKCIFINFSANTNEPLWTKEWINLNDKNATFLWLEQLKPKDCTFLYSPEPEVINFFSHRFPRWFYNISEVDLQRALFVTSLKLPGLATLKGDFALIDKTKSRVPQILLDELIKRKKVIIIKTNLYEE